MKLRLVALVLGFAGCASIPPPGPAGHIILDEEHAMTPAYWKPTEEDVRMLERELARLVASPDARVSGMERAKLSEYGVKYYGTVEAGRRVIVGKGVHVSRRSLRNLQEENDRPGVIQLETFGGGSLYFTVVYDPAAKKTLYVHANAPL